jgi:hypothetical protein
MFFSAQMDLSMMFVWQQQLTDPLDALLILMSVISASKCTLRWQTCLPWFDLSCNLWR